MDKRCITVADTPVRFSTEYTAPLTGIDATGYSFHEVFMAVDEFGRNRCTP